MKITGVLLRSVQDQIAGGDHEPVDPNRVEFDPNDEFPILENFRSQRVIGKGRMRLENGQLLVDAEIEDSMINPKNEKPFPGQFAIGTQHHADGRHTMWTAALGVENVDRGLPPAEIVE